MIIVCCFKLITKESMEIHQSGYTQKYKRGQSSDIVTCKEEFYNKQLELVTNASVLADAINTQEVLTKPIFIKVWIIFQLVNYSQLKM